MDDYIDIGKAVEYIYRLAIREINLHKAAISMTGTRHSNYIKISFSKLLHH